MYKKPYLSFCFITSRPFYQIKQGDQTQTFVEIPSLKHTRVTNLFCDCFNKQYNGVVDSHCYFNHIALSN